MTKAETEKATNVLQVKEEPEKKAVEEISVEKEKQQQTTNSVIEEKVEQIPVVTSPKTKSPEDELRFKESRNEILTCILLKLNYFIVSLCKNSIDELNKNNVAAQSTKALGTIKMFLQKIIRNPEDAKLRRIPFTNKIYSERIKSVDGAEKLLEAIGFTQSADAWSLNFEDQNKELDVEILKEFNSLIESALSSQSNTQ
jgi:hypothetical protein